MNWGAFDLNLLIVFDAVMQERSVTRAGGRLGLSQPAVSHALGQLRHMLKDELFIRTPEGMVPTPRAEQLAEPLRRALNDMQLALEPETFVPKEASRQFMMAINNYAAVILASPLLMAVTAAAPRIRLDLRPTGLRDISALLDRGELDLAIGTFDEGGERFASAPLLENSFVVAMRHDHSAARNELTPRSLASLSYLDISSSGEETGFVDDWLATRGLDQEHHSPRAPLGGRRGSRQHRYGRRAQPPSRRTLGAVIRPLDLPASLCIPCYPHRNALASPVRQPSGPPLAA